MLKTSGVYQASFEQRQEDIFTLGESVMISRPILNRLLLEKSIETDVFALYLRMIDTQTVSPSDAKTFMSAFKTGCLQVFRAALNEQDYNYSGIAFMERWSEYVLFNYDFEK